MGSPPSYVKSTFYTIFRRSDLSWATVELDLFHPCFNTALLAWISSFPSSFPSLYTHILTPALSSERRTQLYPVAIVLALVVLLLHCHQRCLTDTTRLAEHSMHTNKLVSKHLLWSTLWYMKLDHSLSQWSLYPLSIVTHSLSSITTIVNGFIHYSTSHRSHSLSYIVLQKVFFLMLNRLLVSFIWAFNIKLLW